MKKMSDFMYIHVENYQDDDNVVRYTSEDNVGLEIAHQLKRIADILEANN